MSEVKNSYCVGSRHMSGNVDPKSNWKKLILELKKRVKIIRSKCNICGKKQSSNFYYVK